MPYIKHAEVGLFMGALKRCQPVLTRLPVPVLLCRRNGCDHALLHQQSAHHAAVGPGCLFLPSSRLGVLCLPIATGAISACSPSSSDLAGEAAQRSLLLSAESSLISQYCCWFQQEALEEAGRRWTHAQPLGFHLSWYRVRVFVYFMLHFLCRDALAASVHIWHVIARAIARASSCSWSSCNRQCGAWAGSSAV